MKKIGIDYRLAISSHRGMGRYIREIVKELKKIDKGNEYILFVDREMEEELPSNFKYKSINCRNYILFEQFFLPITAKDEKIDILWCPANTFPLILSTNTRLFVTIHDLIFMNKEIKESEKIYQQIGKYYRKFVVAFGKNKIDKCFTDSEYSKRDIYEKLNINSIITSIKIDNFRELIDNEYNETNILEKLSLKKNNYYYTVSGDSPSKNLDILLKVYSTGIIKEKMVISGIKNYKNSVIYKKIREKNLESYFLFSDFISDIEMIDLYKNCKAFLFLSLAEGFGIPILEAMFFNVPIIASNRTSIPEVLGEGGTLVEPQDVDEIIKNIQNIENIDRKDLMMKQSKQLDKYFAWEKTAKLVYNELIKE